MSLINFDQLDEIIELINDGGIGIIPTETVYGIVCKQITMMQLIVYMKSKDGQAINLCRH